VLASLHQGSRKMVDTVEEKLAAASQRLTRGKDKYERLARILIGVKAGIDHLTEKLSGLRSGEAYPVLGTLSSVVVSGACEYPPMLCASAHPAVSLGCS
jgi:hypothetical protein